MDEVLRIKKELEKTSTKNDARRVLELFKELDSMPITLEVLKGTHIGLAVNKLRKAIDDSEIGTIGKRLMKRWKKIAGVDQKSTNGGSNSSANNNNTNNSSGNSNNSNLANGSSSISTNSTPSTQDNPAQQPAQPTAGPSRSTDEPRNNGPAPRQSEVPTTNSEVRLTSRKMLTTALKKPLPTDLAQNSFYTLEEDILAARIEECIFQEFKSADNPKYRNSIRSRVSNLSSNANLRYNVVRGDISPEKMAKMTHDEMASDELKRQRQQYTQEAINDHQMSLTSGTRTSEIKCPACKKSDTTYNQVQTRSADEPMTTFCFCNECGKRWKFC